MSNKPTIAELETRLATLRAENAPIAELIDTLHELANQSSFDPRRMLHLSQEAWEHAQTLRDLRRQVRSLMLLGAANTDIGHHALALSQIFEAQTLAQQLEDDSFGADISYRLVAIYRRTGLYTEMLAHCFSALKHYQAHNNQQGQTRTLNEIAIAYGDLGDYDQAIQYFNQALAISRDLGDERGIASRWSNIGYEYIRKGDYDQAHQVLTECLEYCTNLKRNGIITRGYGFALDNMSELLYRLGRPEEALAYALMAQEENRLPDGSARLNDLEAAILLDMGRIYRLLGNPLQARALFEQAIEHCIATELIVYRTQAHRELAQFYEDQGEYEQALIQFKQLYTVDKTRFNVYNDQKLHTLQVLHETETAQRTAAIYQEENAKLEHTISELERTKGELQIALLELRQRTEAQERLIAENIHQRMIIHELSVPVLPITSDILVMPLIGALDSSRLRELRETALTTISQTSARALMIDITGVPIIDTQIAQGIIKTIQAAKLLGTKVVLIGIRPEVAQAIIGLGLDLHGIRTSSDLQSALRMEGVLKDLPDHDKRSR